MAVSIQDKIKNKKWSVIRAEVIVTSERKRHEVGNSESQELRKLRT